MQYLTTLTKMFYFTNYANYAVFLNYCLNEISKYTHSAVSSYYY